MSIKGQKKSAETRAKMSAYRQALYADPEERRKVAERSTVHGMSHTPTYGTWYAMKQRCTNPRNKNYQTYGARGVTVCESWLTFANFYADMGERPDGMTLDRIDNDRGYEPGNCRWATPHVQRINRRSKQTG